MPKDRVVETWELIARETGRKPRTVRRWYELDVRGFRRIVRKHAVSGRPVASLRALHRWLDRQAGITGTRR